MPIFVTVALLLIIASLPRGISLPRAHAQGVKQSVYMSVVVVVVVVVGTKIARSRVLGVCACYKHNQSVDIGEKNGLYALRISRKSLLVLQIVHFLFSMPVVYRPHPLFWYADATAHAQALCCKGSSRHETATCVPHSIAILR